ncbi:MAG: hypothetical protein ACRD2Z_10745 [Thermoanaerobaculia bacterium]
MSRARPLFAGCRPTLFALTLSALLVPPAPGGAQDRTGLEEALAGPGYTYDSGGRRDPFVSLLEARTAPRDSGPRPAGLRGLSIDEIRVSGIFVTARGAAAQISSGDGKATYLVRAGDRLFDGEVLAISDGEVVFRQELREATALKPYREVVKKLNP